METWAYQSSSSNSSPGSPNSSRRDCRRRKIQCHCTETLGRIEELGFWQHLNLAERGGRELGDGGGRAHHEGDEHRAAPSEGNAWSLAGGGGALRFLSSRRHRRRGLGGFVVGPLGFGANMVTVREKQVVLESPRFFLALKSPRLVCSPMLS
jgi:hypothetical protein